MPWPAEHGDDADDDLPPSPPLPPEDRLWRHPSEVAWTRPAAPVGTAGATSGPRLWAVALTSGLTGAVLAVGVIAVVAGFGGPTTTVVERVPVAIERASTGTATAAGPTVVADSVSPSIVRVEVSSAEGGSSGSGVVFRDDGTVLTSAHVVDGASSVTVVLADGMGYDARIVGTDRLSDVAVLAVDGGDDVQWVPAVLGSARTVEVGQQAIAIGSPLGLAGPPSVTVGVISAVGRRVTAGDGAVLHDMIQTDAPIARGSSGGALCDGDGVVIGLTSAVATGDSGGLGFATPIDVVKSVADEILAVGAVHNAWLGIEGADLDPTQMSIPGAEELGGALVHAVTAGGPAHAAGIVAGDVVVAVDGRRITSMTALVVALRGKEPGETMALDVRRGAERLVLSVTLAERSG